MRYEHPRERRIVRRLSRLYGAKTTNALGHLALAPIAAFVWTSGLLLGELLREGWVSGILAGLLTMTLVWPLPTRVTRLLLRLGWLDATGDEPPAKLPVSERADMLANIAFYMFHGAIGGAVIYGLITFSLDVAGLDRSIQAWFLASGFLFAVVFGWYGWSDIE